MDCCELLWIYCSTNPVNPQQIETSGVWT